MSFVVATLDLPTKALLERVDREIDRLRDIATPGTAHVGGMAKLGQALEQCLLEVLRLWNAELGIPFQVRFGADTPPIPVDKVTAGAAMRALDEFARQSNPRDPHLRHFWDLCRPGGSAVRAIIALRNDSVHGRRELTVEEQRVALSRLRTLLDTWRRGAGLES